MRAVLSMMIFTLFITHLGLPKHSRYCRAAAAIFALLRALFTDKSAGYVFPLNVSWIKKTKRRLDVFICCRLSWILRFEATIFLLIFITLPFI
jgi:hypothetical protein